MNVSLTCQRIFFRMYQRKQTKQPHNLFYISWHSFALNALTKIKHTPNFLIHSIHNKPFLVRIESIICTFYLTCLKVLSEPWLRPVILATQEAEIRRIEVWSQPRQAVCKTLSQKNPPQKKGWYLKWLKL
jgi:hypothetical protein